MRTGRLEAFSDGVLAIIITIMVLALKLPPEPTLSSLWSTTGVGLFSYLLSFVYVGIYWNNHHHLLQAADRLTGAALWANLNLLFWLSLMPFTTAWLAESSFAHVPLLCYGVVLLVAALAYMVFQYTLVKSQCIDSPARRALRLDGWGTSTRDKVSLALYSTGILISAFAVAWLGDAVVTGLALAAYVAVALIWLIPDRRLETELRNRLPD